MKCSRKNPAANSRSLRGGRKGLSAATAIALFSWAAAAPERPSAQEEALAASVPGRLAGTLSAGSGSPAGRATRPHSPWVDPVTEALARAGIERIFSMDFEGAQAQFHKILDADPNQPNAHFGLAGVTWVQYVYGPDQGDPALEAEFQRRIRTSILKSGERLKSAPKDANAFLTLGGSYGMRSRLHVVQKRWFRAILDGRRALKATREAYRLDPDMHDALLGIGMWEYYADVFPKSVKSLGKLLLGGDRPAGIRHIQSAAERSRFVGITASLILIEIYKEDPFGARDLHKALRLARGLRERFPDSPIFHQIEQACLFAAGDLRGFQDTTEDYLRRIDARQPFYLEGARARMQVALGVLRMKRKDAAGAREAFAAASLWAGSKTRPGLWGVLGLLRLGEAEDALLRRQAALRHYRAVLDYPDRWGLHEAASARLEHPFRQGSVPMEFP